MKLLSLLFLILIISATKVFAQSNNIHYPDEFFKFGNVVSESSRGIIEEKDIEGSPYLNKEFVEGTIYTNQKNQYNNIPIRYNIYTDELEYRTPDNQILTLATPQIVEKADFGDYSISNIFYLRGKSIKPVF